MTLPKPPSDSQGSNSDVVKTALDAYKKLEPSKEQLLGLDKRMAALLATPPGQPPPTAVTTSTSTTSAVLWSGATLLAGAVAWLALAGETKAPEAGPERTLSSTNDSKTHDRALPPAPTLEPIQVQESQPVPTTQLPAPAPSSQPNVPTNKSIHRRRSPRSSVVAKTKRETEALDRANCIECELKHVTAARKAMLANEFSQALAQTSAHQRDYPAGVLAEEREAIAIRALYRLRDTEKAVRRHEAFSKNFSNSIYEHELQKERP